MRFSGGCGGGSFWCDEKRTIKKKAKNMRTVDPPEKENVGEPANNGLLSPKHSQVNKNYVSISIA